MNGDNIWLSQTRPKTKLYVGVYLKKGLIVWDGGKKVTSRCTPALLASECDIEQVQWSKEGGLISTQDTDTLQTRRHHTRLPTYHSYNNIVSKYSSTVLQS